MPVVSIPFESGWVLLLCGGLEARFALAVIVSIPFESGWVLLLSILEVVVVNGFFGWQWMHPLGFGVGFCLPTPPWIFKGLILLWKSNGCTPFCAFLARILDILLIFNELFCVLSAGCPLACGLAGGASILGSRGRPFRWIIPGPLASGNALVRLAAADRTACPRRLRRPGSSTSGVAARWRTTR